MNQSSTITKVLNQRIDCVTQEEVLSHIDFLIKQKQRGWIFAMNVHILLLLKENPQFASLHNQANSIFNDSTILLWLSRIRALSIRVIPERVSGTDLVERLLRGGHSIFLIGSSSNVLDILQKKYPDTVVGMYAPPYSNTWSPVVNQKICTLIRQSKAEIVLVGVGPLKQERWVMTNLAKTTAWVGLGIGSALDILSGKTPRAPRIVQTLGSEWLWRVMIEPKRLFFRYLEDGWELFRLIIVKLSSNR